MREIDINDTVISWDWHPESPIGRVIGLHKYLGSRIGDQVWETEVTVEWCYTNFGQSFFQEGRCSLHRLIVVNRMTIEQMLTHDCHAVREYGKTVCVSK